MTASQNNLLDMLPRKDRAHLLVASDVVRLSSGQVLGQPGGPLRWVYFPKDAGISLLALVDDHQGVEVGTVGPEGMLGAHVALGVAAAPVRSEVCQPGDAWRLELPAFKHALARLPALQRSLSAYVSVLMTQLTTTAGCFCFHEIGPRLARRILIAHDLAQVDRFALTQDSLARLLGVRRSSVSSAAGAFRIDGLIDYKRGEMTVLKRESLEVAACSCYAAFGCAYSDGFSTKNLGR